MLLYLINPINPVVSMNKIEQNRWSKYRIWKPLGLLVLAGLTPPDWDIKIIDENLEIQNYNSMPRPDLVGITAFTSQAERAYHIAAEFRNMGVPVIMTNLPFFKYIEKKYKCGICIGDFKHLNDAIQLISENYNEYSANALKCFNKELRFDDAFEVFYRQII